jgi:hypothetical protein
MRDGALVRVLTLAAIALAALPRVPASACDVCQLQLRHRTGPYAITLAKEARWSDRPELRITIANGGSRAVTVGGESRTSPLGVNVVAPTYKSIEPVDSYVAPIRPALVGPHATSTFRIKLRQRFDKPGVYRLNASLGNVDSNILTYSIK